MSKEIQQLLDQAEKGRILYKQNKISRDEAAEYVMPYIEACNEKSKKLARKYNQNPKLINFASFIR